MEKELRILMLEDEEEDAKLLDRVLTKERIRFTRTRASSREDFINALDTFNPDLILSDHALPQFNSIEALRIVQKRKINVPFIIVTGTVSEEFAVSCLRKGADDYILKSNLSRLPSAISHSLHEHENNKVRKEQKEALEKQNADLIKINKELDSFVYSISHNLRSPLASVIGVVNIAKLDHTKNKGAVEHYFDMIGKSTLKLDDTLKEILEYSQNLRTDLEISRINLKEIVDESFDRLKYLKGSSAIEKQFDINNEEPFHSDRHRLSTLITHLLSNAIKYRDERKSDRLIKIKVTISSAQAIINVWDNGVGIHQDYLPNVFNMFFRANEKSEGAGLGLYVVKEVVQKLKGTIDIKSEYGQWTQVLLTLPNIKTE